MKPTQEHRDKLKNISQMMARIHKALIDDQFKESEKYLGYPLATGTRLQMLLNDAEYAWLRHLSQLMTMIDDIYFQKEPITEEQMAAAHMAAEDLFVNRKNLDFIERYEVRGRTLPEIPLEHSKLLAALKTLKNPAALN